MNTGKMQPSPALDLEGIRSIDAGFQISYHFPVYFDDDIFNPANSLLHDTLVRQREQPPNILIYIDSGVAHSNPGLIDKISTYFDECGDSIALLGRPAVITGGEAVKHESKIRSLHKDMLKHELDRHCCVLAIGGGALLDAVGFACCTFHRGIPLLRIPSTVLAQNDAGIGVKNGYNAEDCKNLIGTFAPPFAVINDFSLLTTLDQRDRISGLAEAVKVAAIRDTDFFNWLEINAERLIRFEEKCTRYAIARCAQLHLDQITHGGDPFESGNARPLDYGHWSAHKLEALLCHDIRHGEAVAIGMALDTIYAHETGMLDENKTNRMLSLLKKLGFTLWNDVLQKTDDAGKNLLLHGLEEFRQHLGGRLCITLLTDIGTAIEVGDIDTDRMTNAIAKLSEHR